MIYLTSRIQTLRQETDYLTKKEQLLPDEDIEGKNVKEEKVLSSKQKENIIYGLGHFKTMLTNMKNSEGDSRDNDDHEFVAMIQHIQDSIYSLENSRKLTLQMLQKKILTPLQEKWEFFRYWNVGNFNGDKDWTNEFNSIAKGSSKEKMQQIIRSLGESTSMGSNTHTSFLTDEIDNEIELEGTEYDIYMKNITEKLENFDQGNTATLDKILDTQDGSELGRVLRTAKILPGYDEISKKKQDKLLKPLSEKIKQHKKTIEKNLPTPLSISTGRKNEIAILQYKSNKTLEDIQKLQALTFLIENQENHAVAGLIKETIEKSSTSIMYFGIADIVRSNVTPTLAKAAGGTDSDIYDDIVGAGNSWEIFQRSDANATMVQDILASIAEEITIMLIVSALIASGIGAGAGAALGASRIARRGSIGRKSIRLSTYTKKLTNAKWITKIKQGKNFQKIKNMKVFNNKATRYLGSKSNILTSAADKGFLHTTLSATYHGEWDKKFNEHLVSFLQNTTMYSVLGLVGKSAQSGRIAKRFKNVEKGKSIKIKGASYIFEELGMNPADMAISYTFSNRPMTLKEVMNNIAMGLMFEFVPGVKKVVMRGTSFVIDGIVKTVPKTIKLIETQAILPSVKDIDLITRERKKLDRGKINTEHLDTYIQVRNTLETRGYTKAQMHKFSEQDWKNLDEYINDPNNLGYKDGYKSLSQKDFIAEYIRNIIGKDPSISVRAEPRKEKVHHEISAAKEDHTIRELERKRDNSNAEIKDIDTQITQKKQRIENLRTERAKIRSEYNIDENISLNTLVYKLGLKKGHIVTKKGIPGKKWQILSIKDDKIILIKQGTGKSERIKITDLKEMYEQGWRLNNKQKNNNGKTKQNLFDEMYKQSLNIIKEAPRNIKKKINALESRKKILLAEIKKIETNNSTPSLNSFFTKHSERLVGKHMYNDGKKYNIQKQKDGTLQLKLQDGNYHITISSFIDLQRKGFQMLSEQNNGRTDLGRTETENIKLRNELLSGEKEYMNTRTETLANKKENIKNINEQITKQHTRYQQAKSRQTRVKEKADLAGEKTKEIGKIEREIEGLEKKKNEHEYDNTKRQEKLNNIEHTVSHLEDTHGKRGRIQQQYSLEMFAMWKTLDTTEKTLLTKNMQKFLDAETEVDLSKKLIEDIQREIGIPRKEVDGVLGPKTRKKWEKYLFDRKEKVEFNSGGEVRSKKKTIITTRATKRSIEIKTEAEKTKIETDITNQFNQCSTKKEINLLRRKLAQEYHESKQGGNERFMKYINISRDTKIKEIELKQQNKAIEDMKKSETFNDKSSLYNFIDLFSKQLSERGDIFTNKLLALNKSFNEFVIHIQNKFGILNRNILKQIKDIKQKINNKIEISKNKKILKQENTLKSEKVTDLELSRYTGDKVDIDYKEKAIQGREYFKKWFQSSTINLNNFKRMIKDMHEISAYKDGLRKIGEIRNREVIGGTRPRAVEYTKMIGDVLNLGDISQTNIARTQYASPKEFDRVFTECTKLLNNIRKESNKGNPYKTKILSNISDYYHNMIYARPMGNVNNSMFMNQINYLLKMNGLGPISHGHLDHLATRVNKKQFRKIFLKNLINPLPLSQTGISRDIKDFTLKEQLLAENNLKWAHFRGETVTL